MFDNIKFYVDRSCRFLRQMSKIGRIFYVKLSNIGRIFYFTRLYFLERLLCDYWIEPGIT